MRIETQLKRRDNGVSSLRDLYSRAARYGMSSSDLNSHYNEIVTQCCTNAPQWIKTYLDGYRAALTDNAYRCELVYGGFVDGHFYSTHSNRPDYYERNGIEPREYADDGKVTERGHYWIASVDAGTPKAFFV